MYRTLEAISKRMGWKSPSTVLRRHKLDDFPIYPDFGRRGLVWVTSDALIEQWETRKVAMNRGGRLKQPWKWRHKESFRPYNWRLRKQIDTDMEKLPNRTKEAPYLREDKSVKAEPERSAKSDPPTRPFTARIAERWIEQRKRAKGA